MKHLDLNILKFNYEYQTIVNDIEYHDNKEDFINVTNLWVKKKDGTVEKNSITKPVDINKNPIIDTSLFEEARLYRPMAGKVYKMYPVETIRGCPYTCKFCNSPDQMRLY